MLHSLVRPQMTCPGGAAAFTWAGTIFPPDSSGPALLLGVLHDVPTWPLTLSHNDQACRHLLTWRLRSCFLDEVMMCPRGL